ncbi:MAG: hypothetical protein NVV60_00615 [Luteimonas sp.]|nr:hypothetical protein [Luteimonas sp.]
MITKRAPYDQRKMDEICDFMNAFLDSCEIALAKGTEPDFKDYTDWKLRLALQLWKFKSERSSAAQQHMGALRERGFDTTNVVAIPRCQR